MHTGQTEAAALRDTTGDVIVHAGLYQAGPRNKLFSAWALGCWMANACYQASVMFAMVIKATPAIYADRSSGKTYTHWEVLALHMPSDLLLQLHVPGNPRSAEVNTCNCY